MCYGDKRENTQALHYWPSVQWPNDMFAQITDCWPYYSRVMLYRIVDFYKFSICIWDLYLVTFVPVDALAPNSVKASTGTDIHSYFTQGPKND